MPCVISRSTILRSLAWHCKELVWNLLPSSEVYATYIVIDCISGMQVLDEFYSSLYCLWPCTLRSTQLSVTFLWKSIVRTGRSLCVFLFALVLVWCSTEQTVFAVVKRRTGRSTRTHSAAGTTSTVISPFSDVLLNRQLGAEVLPAFGVYNLSRCDTDISLP